MVKRLTNKAIRDKLRARKCQDGRCNIRLSVKRAELVSQALTLRLINRIDAHGESKIVLAKRRAIVFVELINKFIDQLARSKKRPLPTNKVKSKFIHTMMLKLDPNKKYNIPSKRAFKYTRKQFMDMYPQRDQALAARYR